MLGRVVWGPPWPGRSGPLAFGWRARLRREEAPTARAPSPFPWASATRLAECAFRPQNVERRDWCSWTLLHSAARAARRVSRAPTSTTSRTRCSPILRRSMGMRRHVNMSWRESSVTTRPADWATPVVTNRLLLRATRKPCTQGSTGQPGLMTPALTSAESNACSPKAVLAASRSSALVRFPPFDRFCGVCGQSRVGDRPCLAI